MSGRPQGRLFPYSSVGSGIPLQEDGGETITIAEDFACDNRATGTTPVGQSAEAGPPPGARELPGGAGDPMGRFVV